MSRRDRRSAGADGGWGDPVAAEGGTPSRGGAAVLTAARPTPARGRPAARRRRRVRYRVGGWRRLASLLELVVVVAVLAAVASGILAGIVAGISLALHSVGG